jgi:hypothetical protein
VSLAGSSGRFISRLTIASFGWITSVATEDYPVPLIGYYSGSTKAASLYCFKKSASDSAIALANLSSSFLIYSAKASSILCYLAISAALPPRPPPIPPSPN